MPELSVILRFAIWTVIGALLGAFVGALIDWRGFDEWGLFGVAVLGAFLGFYWGARLPPDWADRAFGFVCMVGLWALFIAYMLGSFALAIFLGVKISLFITNLFGLPEWAHPTLSCVLILLALHIILGRIAPYVTGIIVGTLQKIGERVPWIRERIKKPSETEPTEP